MRKCLRCGEEKPETNEFFARNPSAKSGLHAWCKECMREYQREHAKKPGFAERRRAYQHEYRRRPHVAERDRRDHIRRKYGIPWEQYEEMLTRQNGCCAICQQPADKYDVDHCHETGRVRGLLCPKCNKALGLMGDNPEVLKRAAEYIQA